MVFSIGLDIGGTKIAGIRMDDGGREHARLSYPTPASYSEFLTVCRQIVRELKADIVQPLVIGVGLPGAINPATGITPFVSNIPYLSGQSLRTDLADTLQSPVHIANDAGCAALSEAIDGTGAHDPVVFTVILGTGVGGGLVINHQIIEGANNIAGEIGHLPLPFRDRDDGPLTACNCGQQGCIDKTASGTGLESLYRAMGGDGLTALQIANDARSRKELAVRVVDRFYTIIAKAMVTIIHTYDPGTIVISGGLSGLPNLPEIVSKRWGQYCLLKKPNTKLCLAKHGAMTGLRGAAWLGQKHQRHEQV